MNYSLNKNIHTYSSPIDVIYSTQKVKKVLCFLLLLLSDEEVCTFILSFLSFYIKEFKRETGTTNLIQILQRKCNLQLEVSTIVKITETES